MKISAIQDIPISDYNYNLPDERIAKYPLERRDKSKLLFYRNGQIEENTFSSLAEYIPENSLMIFNNTKVIQARMYFQKLTGATIEIFCLEPHHPRDYALILQENCKCSWICLVGNLKKWKDGDLSKIIEIGGKKIELKAHKLQTNGDSQIIEFEWEDDSILFSDILETGGELPIPPYLNRKTEEHDKEAYQTIYSKVKGSVAAPTAGLHFTDEGFDRLAMKGIRVKEVTLHVGAGTFKPVKTGTIEKHIMHTEFISVPKATIIDLLQHTGKVIAVGTTSVRTLESLYHIGVLLEDNWDAELKVTQWQPYENRAASISSEKALENVIQYLEKNNLETLFADTQIIIAPGYDFKVVDGIVTNFHQPQSTLLLLVSAFVNGDWQRIYNYALNHKFRFLSYGDSSLLMK